MDTGNDAKASPENASCNDGEKRDDGNREASMESVLEILLARLDGLEAAVKSQHDVMLSVLQPLINCTVVNEKEKSLGMIALDDKGLYRDGRGETCEGSSHETATRGNSTDKKDINGDQNANNILTQRGTNHNHQNENSRDLRKHKSEDVGRRLRTIPEDDRLPAIRTRPSGQTELSKQDLTKVSASLQDRSGPASRSELKRRKAAFVARSTSNKDQKPYLALIAAKRQAEISAQAARRAQEEEDDDSWGLLAYIILIIFGALALIGGAAALAITKHMARDVKLNNRQAEL